MVQVIVQSGGTSGPRGNSVLNGTGAPAGTVGIDGDWYIDTVANKLYGPRASGAWPSTGIPMSASTAGALLAANNLSALASASTARSNLGLGTAATASVGTTAGTVAAGNDSRITGALQAANNLSDLASPSTALTNLGAVATSTLGAASGVATLDSTGMVTVAQVPGVYMPPTRRMPRWVQPSTIITQMQAGHGFVNNAGSTLVANDTSDFLIPSQSCKITTGGTGAAANLSRLGGTAVDSTGKMVRFRIKVDDITHMTGLNFFLGSSSLANNYKWIVQGAAAGSNYVVSGGAAGSGAGWYTVTLHFADATTSGTPTRSGLTDVRWAVTDDATAQVTLHVQDLELIPDASTIFPNGVISIGFDDTYASVYQYGLPKLQQYGYQATVYNIQSLIGGTGRMTTTQLYALQDEFGWEMGTHAYTDADHSLTYTGMTAAQLDSDLRQMKAWEIANGMRGMDGTAYPLGQYGLTTDNVPTTSIVRKYNGYARTTTRKTSETFPPADAFRLRAQSSIGSYTGNYPAATVTGTDLPKIKSSQLWGIFVFHDIITGTPASSTQITQADFNSIIDAIASSGIPVIPVGDVLRYYG